MRNSDSPYLPDLFAISLRWLALFGLTISLGAGGGLALGARGIPVPVPLPLLLLSFYALWNGFLSALAIFNRRLKSHRILNVALDVLFSITIYIAAGGVNGGVFWVALLPLFSGAIYYETRGALLVSVSISLLQFGYLYLLSSQNIPWVPIGIMAVFNLVAGAGAAAMGAPLMHRLRLTYQGTVTQRKESERKVQRQEHDRMSALFSMIETFSATLNYQTVLETVLDTAIAALDERKGSAEDMVGAVMLFGDRHDLEIRVSRGFIARDATVTLPAEEGVLNDILKHGGTKLVQMPREDPELGKLLTLQERTVVLCLSLIRGMNAYGVILFAHSNPNFFTPERIETLQMLGNQAVISIQNARLYQDLAHEKERIIQTQEEAQKKLARDLHDGPTQSVSAIAMRINIARKILEKSAGDPAVKDATTELVRIEELARRTTQEIRHMLFTLRPLVLETEGLEAALQTMADKMRDLYQQNVIVDVDPVVIQQLDMARQTVVFYLVDESVNNCRKHAEAKEIRVRLKLAPNDECIAVLEIIDNGIGFNVESVMSTYDRRGSLGMINLQERSELINGLLKIDSVPGKGSRVRVLIPLTEDAADRLHQRR